MEGLRLRRLEAADLDAVVAIQQASPEAAAWRREDYARVLCGEMVGWVAERATGVVGFLVVRHVADELEIMNFAVAPTARRAGVAGLLLEQALEQARGCGIRRVFLEVRESNHAAQLFYAQHGFQPAGQRVAYYSGPREDALLLARRLP